jgi:phenylacetate-coenzyme A ligase PaaK-like adenylate-forming protein
MEKRFWSEIEALTREEIKQLQLKRLKDQVEYLHNNSPYYKRK